MHLIRPTSPKSPGASAFESVEGSDDEDTFTDNSKMDPAYLLSNGNTVSLRSIHENYLSFRSHLQPGETRCYCFPLLSINSNNSMSYLVLCSILFTRTTFFHTNLCLQNNFMRNNTVCFWL